MPVKRARMSLTMFWRRGSSCSSELVSAPLPKLNDHAMQARSSSSPRGSDTACRSRRRPESLAAEHIVRCDLQRPRFTARSPIKKTLPAPIQPAAIGAQIRPDLENICASAVRGGPSDSAPASGATGNERALARRPSRSSRAAGRERASCQGNPATATASSAKMSRHRPTKHEAHQGHTLSRPPWRARGMTGASTARRAAAACRAMFSPAIRSARAAGRPAAYRVPILPSTSIATG